MNISHLVEKIKREITNHLKSSTSLQSVKCGLLVSAF